MTTKQWLLEMLRTVEVVTEPFGRAEFKVSQGHVSTAERIAAARRLVEQGPEEPTI